MNMISHTRLNRKFDEIDNELKEMKKKLNKIEAILQKCNKEK